MKSAARIGLIAVALLSVTSIASARDKRLAGKCTFLAWTIKRSADGKFDIAFYKNAAKTKLISRETGRWETDGDKLSLFTKGTMVPDIYIYTFPDSDSVHLSLIKRDPSADCQADYEFTDHRVKP